MLAVVLADDTAPGAAQDEPGCELPTQLGLPVVDVGRVLVELHGDREVVTLRGSLAGVEDALARPDCLHGRGQFGLRCAHFGRADDPQRGAGDVLDVQDVELTEGEGCPDRIHGFASQAMAHRLGADGKTNKYDNNIYWL